MEPCWDFESKLNKCNFITVHKDRAKAKATMQNHTIYLHQRAWKIEQYFWKTIYGVIIENLDIKKTQEY